MADCIWLANWFFLSRLNIDTISHELRFNFGQNKKIWIQNCANETPPWNPIQCNMVGWEPVEKKNDVIKWNGIWLVEMWIKCINMPGTFVFTL